MCRFVSVPMGQFLSQQLCHVGHGCVQVEFFSQVLEALRLACMHISLIIMILSQKSACFGQVVFANQF